MSLAISSKESILDEKLEEEVDEKVEDEDMETFLTELEVTEDDCCTEEEDDCCTEEEDDCWTEEVRAPAGLAASPSLLGALMVRTPSLERAVATSSMLALWGIVNSL